MIALKSPSCLKHTDVVLVNPLSRKIGNLSAIEPPIWAGLMADNYQQRGLSVAIIDADVERLTHPQIVERITKLRPSEIVIVVMGINPSASSTPKMTSAIRLAQSLQHYNIPISFAGLHPQALKHETLRVGVVDYITSTFSGTPNIAYSLLPMSLYKAHNWHCLGDIPRSPYAVTYTSLNCPYNCYFCNIHSLYGDRKVRYRPLDNVIKEIVDINQCYGVRNWKIWDELFTLDKERVIELCERLIGLKFNPSLNIWAYARVGTVDTEMLALMKLAGINWLCFGFEAVSNEVRQQSGKSYSLDAMEDDIYSCQTFGINILANFIFGLPEDSEYTMRETLEWAKRRNFEFANFYCAMPYPGSQLYEDTPKELLPQNWEDYDQYSPNFKAMPTKYLGGEDVLKFRDKAFVEYFDRPEYFKMIQRKFGDTGVSQIKEMLKWTIR